MLISTIELLENQSLLSTPLPPQSDYGTNQYPQIMPWLGCETVNCNCSRFPELSNVILPEEPTPKRAVEMNGKKFIRWHTCILSGKWWYWWYGSNIVFRMYEIKVVHILWTFSCKLKQWAGQKFCWSYIMNLQMWLIELLLCWKCNNMMENGHPLATPQGKKVQNILDVFLSGIIKFVTFKKIEYLYSWSIIESNYIPTLIVAKEGHWPRDNDTYSYND